MPSTLHRVVFGLLRKVRTVQEGAEVDDSGLLERFLVQREEAAFEALVQRHGPMVLGVCQRIVGDMHAAEDAFQATFLVLAQRAAAIRKQASVASWLFGVAQRIACRARTQAVVRRRRERRAADMRSRVTLDEFTWQELRGILDEEIGRLPEKCRTAVVLCHLQGKSYDQAAQELGWPKSSLASRLAKGLELLRGQLTRRGFALSAAALLTALSEKATAAPVAAGLVLTLVRAAASVAAGNSVTAATLSPRVLALTHEGMKVGTGSIAKAFVFLVALGLAVGAGFAGYHAWLRQTPPEQPAPLVQRDPPKKEAPGPALDLHGDPLPAGAVARMGQDRWLHHVIASFVAFTPDGKTVVTVSVDRTVRVWEFPSGKEVRRIALPAPDLDPNQRIWAALSGNGKTIATWISDEPSAIYLHDLATGKSLPGPKVTARVFKLAFSPTAEHLAYLTAGGTVRIWDWATAKEVSSFVVAKPMGNKKFGAAHGAICYAPDGKAIATHLGGDQVQLWNPATGDESPTFRSDKLAGTGSLAFSPNGKTLAIPLAESVVLLDAVTGKEIGKLTAPELQFNASYGGPSLVFTRDSKRLYASDYAGDLYEWDTATGKLLRQHFLGPQGTGPMMGASLSPDGSTLVRTGAGPTLLDVRGKEITHLRHRTGTMTSLQFTANGKQLLTIRQGVGPDWIPSAHRWDAATGKDLGKVDLHGLSDLIAISPNQHFVAGNRSEINKFGIVKVLQSVLIEVAGGKESPLPTIPTTFSYPRIRFSSDGKILAFDQFLAERQKSAIGLYDVSAAKLVRTLEGSAARTLIFSPDGKMLAANADGRNLGVWDTMTGKLLGSIPLPKGGPLVYEGLTSGVEMDSAAFSPDGRCLVLDMDDGTAVLYELATRKPRRTYGTKVAPKELPPLLLVGRSHLIPDEYQAGCCFAFSPDGKLLARGGYDHVVRLWDVETGKELAAFKGHDGAVTALAFSPDGKTLASASADSTALIWDVTRVKRVEIP